MAENKKFYDEKGNEIVISASDFEFAQTDKKIHDTKFESVPTTFIKDAFKRFCKNKSSVVAAFIIGILVLLSLIVPIVSPYDVDKPDVVQGELPAKFLNTGTGWWDGTVIYSNEEVNPLLGIPNNRDKEAIVKVLSTEEKMVTTSNANPNAHGGTYVFVSDPADAKRTGRDFNYIRHNSVVKFNATDNYQVKIQLSNEIGAENDYFKELAEYRVVLQLGRKADDPDAFEKIIVLKEWANDHDHDTDETALVINISQIVEEYLNIINEGKEEENKTTFVQGVLRIDAKPNGDVKTGVQIESLEYSTDSTDEAVVELLDAISITDATLTRNYDKKHPGYWAASSTKVVKDTFITYMTYVYDPYEASLGRTENHTIGQTEMDRYIKNGWCEYDYEVGISSFKVLSEKCPIEEVTGQTYIEDINRYSLSTTVQIYKTLGYDKMPKFWFGSDASGRDVVTLAFKSLRTSLIVAVIASAVCFLFGLVWGSISGYFGGNVDLFMERFCDILGGMPWIVVMTLAILLMGNNLVTFIIALCLTGWMGTAARTRTQFYRYKNREYIFSSRTLGASDGRIIFKHILPNALGTIVTSSVLMIPGVIFNESTLAYLNLGLQGTNSFGSLLSNNQKYISSIPSLILFPAAIISLIMISFNLFGNGLRDALNPSLKGSE